MLTFKDRLYGRLELPEIALQLASSCPLLLRLREIRMANVPFHSYPSFAHIDRFEHSLGVAHLAWRWSQANGLSLSDATALCLAGLYHDGATPAFGHLFEEWLSRFGWDHERALALLLAGRSDLPGQEHAQVFLGGHCLLAELLARHPGLGITAGDVAILASGGGTLGRLVCGDLDFDNIDNVLRAASAMGLLGRANRVHPYEIIEGIILERDEVRLRRSSHYAVAYWQQARRILYTEILENQMEFRVQSAIKWAIESAAESCSELRSASAWRLTEPELVFGLLTRSEFSRRLVQRVRLGRPPELLFSCYVDDLSRLLGADSGGVVRDLNLAIASMTNLPVYVNCYTDKRFRAISLPASQQSSGLFDAQVESVPPDQPPLHGKRGILGAIYSSPAEAGVAQYGVRGIGAGRTAADPIELRRMVERTLGSNVSRVSSGWTPLPERDTQLELFQCAQ